MNVSSLYHTLRIQFGPRSDPATWWPIFYGLSDPPEFERVITNILVQSSNWRAVPTAMHALAADNLLTAAALANADALRVATCIKPTGLQAQKADRLINFCTRVVADFSSERAFCQTVTREYLLGVGGIGPETADRILLYACGQPVWPVDTYCLRVFGQYGLITEMPATPKQRRTASEWIKAEVAVGLPPAAEDWQRLHALMQLEGERLRTKH